MVCMVKNGCSYSGLRTLKLALYPETISGINWFLLYWYKFRKAETVFNNFWLVVVKNRCILLGLWTLKSAVSQEWIDEMGWFCACWHSFKKAKSYLSSYWVELLNQVYLINSLLNWANRFNDFCMLIVTL